MLSDGFAAAATDAARASYVAGAELLIALNDVPAAIGVMQAIGILLISLLTLRRTAWKELAWLGVVTGVIGVVAEALKPLLGVAYGTYGALLFAWLIWIALALWQLSAKARQTASTN